MEIINVLEVINGIPSELFSFVAQEGDLSDDARRKAEARFIKLLTENAQEWYKPEELDELIEESLMISSYDDKNGYEIYIINSEV